MISEILPFLLLAFAMGLRHGLDPDHLAIINGVSIQEAQHQSMSRWNGFMFSLGHGLTVTIIGLAIAGIAGAQLFPVAVLSFTEWIPIGLLIFTGLLNLYFLVNNKKHENASHEKFKRLGIGENTSHFKMILIGILFALVFDTASQTATWAIVAQQDDKVVMSLAIGIVFTLGMIITDTANGFLFSYAYQKNIDNKTLISIQNVLGYVIGLTSLILGLHQLTEKLGYDTPLSDNFKFTFGLGIISLIAFAVWFRFYQKRLIVK